MGNMKRWWGLRRRDKTEPAMVSSEPAIERSVDVELIIQAARLAVTTRTASRTLFERHLYVTGDVALHLLAKLEHCEVLAPKVTGKPQRVLTTSAQLPGVVAEFERRHREGTA